MRILYMSILVAVLLQGFPAVSQPGYITMKKGQFFLYRQPYYYAGANYWYGGLLAQGGNAEKGKERLCHELDFLRAQGITNLRVLAAVEGEGFVNGVERVKPASQPVQGQYNDAWLAGLDYLLYEMGKRQMYAVLYLSNNWEWSGGFLQFLNWNGQLPDTIMQRKLGWNELRDYTSRFYSCTPCMQNYQQQVLHLLTHVNKYTGRAYKAEPAIMAWELANEPRPMRAAAVEAYKAWTANTAAYIKSVDRNHLVTLGTEGIMGTEESPALFKAVHTPAAIDYLTLHIWPKNWGWFKDTSIHIALPEIISKTQQYIRAHEAIAIALQKPLVIEEFGLPRDGHTFNPAATTSLRDRYYTAIFEEWQRSSAAGGVIAGYNFWSFGGTARPLAGQVFWKEGDDLMGDPPQEEQGLNTVFDSDSTTWKIIRAYAYTPQ